MIGFIFVCLFIKTTFEILGIGSLTCPSQPRFHGQGAMGQQEGLLTEQ